MKNALGGLLLAVAGAGFGIAGDARACGGCFHPPAAVDAVVTGHRMAFALSPDRTVLWDQIKYTGEPSEFGWVLPVNPGAVIEASTDAWFETLDALTTVQVAAPPYRCASSRSSGFGCGASDASALASAGESNYLNRVNVLHEGTVGPYETVTLSSTDGSALRAWLESHGYVVEPEIEPVIDTYVAEGADFIALRLIPGQGVSSMTPVRVVTPSGPPMLPLRMVAAGTGAFVDIVLYVFGEGRYLLQDFTETRVDLHDLTFDLSNGQSNYLTLRENALGQNNGYSFLTAYSSASPFAQPQSPSGVGQSLANVYFTQAASNDSRTNSCPSIDSALLSSELVGTGIPASRFVCPSSTPGGVGYSDIAAAITGMHPDRVWLTRLELNLPHEALSADCTVALSKEQQAVSKDLVAVKMAGRSSFCPEPVFESSIAPQVRSSTETFAWGTGLFAALFVLRRRRNRRE
jgi:Uncharacterized protein conserved in bacteria (DUF2330)